MRNRVVWITATVVLTAVLAAWLILRSDVGAPVQAPVGAGMKPASLDAASQNSENDPTDDIDESRQTGEVHSPTIDLGSDFRLASACAKFQRLKTFFERAMNDPNSALNNKEVASSLTSQQQRDLQTNLKYVEEHADACEDVGQIGLVGSQDLYKLAGQAASQGDMQAAACFVLAQWPTQVRSELEMQEFRKYYADSAKKLIADGVRRGNWKVVNAAVAAARTQHGIQESLGLTDEERYYWLRLSQLGAATSEWESAIGYEAAAIARGLEGASVAKAEARATSDFSRYFNNRRMKEVDLTSCDV